jgi:hypothetical protein
MIMCSLEPDLMTVRHRTTLDEIDKTKDKKDHDSNTNIIIKEDEEDEDIFRTNDHRNSIDQKMDRN